MQNLTVYVKQQHRYSDDTKLLNKEIKELTRNKRTTEKRMQKHAIKVKTMEEVQ